MTTALLARGERVVDVDRAKRPARRAGVKSDDIDAIRAVRQAVADDAVAELRCRGEREAMRGLLAPGPRPSSSAPAPTARCTRW